MAAVGKFLMSPVLALAGAFKKPKAPEPQVPIAQPQARDRSASVLADTIAGRRGAQANQRSGGGGEPMGGKKTKLGG